MQEPLETDEYSAYGKHWILAYGSQFRKRKLEKYSRKLFREEMAPEGAPKRCTDGCPHRSTCPFFAPKFYLEHPKAIVDGFRKVVTMDETTEGLMEALKTDPYGRCVYACDNDVCDHQIVNMDMEDGLTISFTLSEL